MSPHPLDGIRVLLVDDDVGGCEMFAEMLTSAGADVTVVGSVRAALAAIDVRVPDVLVTDIGMPGEDGYSLVRQMRRRPAAGGGAVPAIALTGYADAEHRAVAQQAGFQAHLAKPIDPDALIATIAACVRRRLARR